MKKYTLRLNKELHQILKNKSFEMGLTLASLIKVNLSELMNNDIPIHHFKVNDTVRMTLSLPLNMYNDLDKISYSKEISLNDLINSILFHYINS